MKDMEQLIDHYQKALLIKSDSPQVYIHLAECYEKQGEIDRAIKAYHHAIELKANAYEAYYQLGKIREKQEQWKQAINCYLKVIFCYKEGDEINPIFIQAYRNLMNIRNKCSLPEAISIYRKIVQEQPDLAMAHEHLGDLLTQQGDLKAAISAYKTAHYHELLHSHPDFVKDYWNPQNPRQPHFLIIGIGKGGTSSLYKYLGKHPQILPAIKKEIHFFNQNMSEGLDWYSAHFPPFLKTLTS